MTRAKAVKNSLDNSALEGLKASPAQLVDLQRFIKGEISAEEGIKRVKERYLCPAPVENTK
jgi:hypothetical protein